MERIEIGAVAKPQGIKGELKIKLFCDGFDQIKNIKSVEINGQIHAVEFIKSCSVDEALLKLEGLDDRNIAETYRRALVYADKKELKLNSGRYFITDVIGSKLYLSSGKEIGDIYDIVSGNVDYYYVNTAEGKAVFPLLKDLLISIDITEKKVVIDAKKFTEVVMYED